MGCLSLCPTSYNFDVFWSLKRRHHTVLLGFASTLAQTQRSRCAALWWLCGSSLLSWCFVVLGFRCGYAGLRWFFGCFVAFPCVSVGFLRLCWFVWLLALDYVCLLAFAALRCVFGILVAPHWFCCGFPVSSLCLCWLLCGCALPLSVLWLFAVPLSAFAAVRIVFCNLVALRWLSAGFVPLRFVSVGNCGSSMCPWWPCGSFLRLYWQLWFFDVSLVALGLFPASLSAFVVL